MALPLTASGRPIPTRRSKNSNWAVRWAHKKYVRELGAALDRVSPSGDELVCAALYFPTETLAHPALPLLSLEDPATWVNTQVVAHFQLLQPRRRRALRSLGIAQHRQIALAALRRLLPSFAHHGAGTAARVLELQLSRLVSGHATLAQTAPPVLALDLRRSKGVAPTLLLWELSGALIARRERFLDIWPKGRRPRKGRPRQTLCPPWTSQRFLGQLCLVMGDPLRPLPPDPTQLIKDVGAMPLLIEMGWQTTAAEALAEGRRMPRTWKLPRTT